LPGAEEKSFDPTLLRWLNKNKKGPRHRRPRKQSYMVYCFSP
jgi:hypothetical protein